MAITPSNGCEFARSECSSGSLSDPSVVGVYHIPERPLLSTSPLARDKAPVAHLVTSMRGGARATISTAPLAAARSTRIAPGSRLLRRRSQRKKRLRSLLLSTVARDPVLIASLAKLARRGSRCDAPYFVVARGRKACPLTPPQHGGARSGLIAPLAVARSASEAINFGVAYRLSIGVAGTVGHMTTQYVVPPEKVRIGAGTALKFGFFAAFGIFLFYLILSVILGTVAILLASAGAFNINNLLPG
jgi:hypothetical protein